MEPIASPMKISLSGMDVEWQRLSVISENIANVNSTRTAQGEPFTPLRLVSGPRADFDQVLAGRALPSGVKVYSVEPENIGVRRVHEPANPDADADGYVAYPNIDFAAEMTTLIKTARAYEANLTALNLGRDMYAKALELGRRS